MPNLAENSRRHPVPLPHISGMPLREGRTAQDLKPILAKIEEALKRLNDGFSGVPGEHQSTHLATGADALRTPAAPEMVTSSDTEVGTGPSYAYEDHVHELEWPLTAPDGSLAVPSYSFASGLSSGLLAGGSGEIDLKGGDGSGANAAGAPAFLLSGRGTGQGAAGALALALAPSVAGSSSTLNTYQDILRAFNNGAIVIGGIDVEGTPGGSYYRGSDRATGIANGIGGSLVLAGGQSTGSADGGTIDFQTAPPGAAGSAQNARVNRWQIQSAGHLVPFADITYDIGSASFRVRDLYVEDIIGDDISELELLAWAM